MNTSRLWLPRQCPSAKPRHADLSPGEISPLAPSSGSNNVAPRRCLPSSRRCCGASVHPPRILHRITCGPSCYSPLLCDLIISSSCMMSCLATFCPVFAGSSVIANLGLCVSSIYTKPWVEIFLEAYLWSCHSSATSHQPQNPFLVLINPLFVQAR